MLALDTPRVCTKINFVCWLHSVISIFQMLGGVEMFSTWEMYACVLSELSWKCVIFSLLFTLFLLSQCYTAWGGAITFVPHAYTGELSHWWPYRTGFRFHVSRIPHGFTAQHHYSRAGVVIPQRMLICRGRPGVIIDHSVWKGLQLFPGVGTVVVWKRALVVVPFSPTCTHHCLFSYSPHFTFSSVTSTHGQSTPSWLWHGRLHQRPEWHALPSHV